MKVVPIVTPSGNRRRQKKFHMNMNGGDFWKFKNAIKLRPGNCSLARYRYLCHILVPGLTLAFAHLEFRGEPVLRPEGPDGGDARDGLAEVQVDRRPAARLEPLHLPRRRDEHPEIVGVSNAVREKKDKLGYLCEMSLSQRLEYFQLITVEIVQPIIVVLNINVVLTYLRMTR